MDLLDDLGPRLRALTADQPAQPGDRVPGATSRARRIRRTRAAVAACVAVVALAVPVALVAPWGQDPSVTQFVSTDVRTWPDRSQSTDRGVAEGALAEFTHEGMYGAEPARDLRWLYRGTVRLPDGTATYVAAFTANDTDLDGQPRHSLVVATADRSDVDAEGRDLERPDDLSSSPWRLRRVDAAKAPTPFGLYLKYGDRRQEVLLLAEPGARTVSWRSTPLPGVPSEQGQSGKGRSQDGVFLLDVGALTGPVEVDLGRGPVGLGLELGTPSLTPPAQPDLPDGWDDVGSVSGQSELGWDGSAQGQMGTNLNGNDKRPMAVFARCYGGGSLGFRLYPLQTKGPIGPGGDAEIIVSSANTPAVATGRVPCDGSSHRAFRPVTVRTDGYELWDKPDRLQAYTYVLASPP